MMTDPYLRIGPILRPQRWCAKHPPRRQHPYYQRYDYDGRGSVVEQLKCDFFTECSVISQMS